MRLREMHHILQTNLNKLSLQEGDGSTTPVGQAIKVLNKENLRGAVKSIERVPGFESIAQDGNIQSIFEAYGSQPIVPADVFKAAATYLQTWRSRANSLAHVLAQVIQPEDPNTLSILLPKVSNLDELVSVVQSLSRALDRPSLMLFRERSTIKSFDVGSNWIEILCSPQVLALATAIVSGAFHYLEKKLEVEKTIKGAAIFAEVEELRIKAKAYENTLKHDIARRIVEKHYPQGAESPGVTAEEVQSNVAESVVEIAEILHHGGEVHPSLLPRPEGSAAPPPVEDVRRIVSGLTPPSHQLGQGSSSGPPNGGGLGNS